MTGSNTATLLFEIGAEELPAKQIRSIADQIKTAIEKILTDSEISFKNSSSLFSPRRIFLEITEINLDSSDKEIEIKGPPEKISLNADGSFSQAALGFAKKNNLEEKSLFIKDGYLHAKQIVQAKSAIKLFELEMPKIIANTQGLRFMRSGYGEMKFARPIQWICALLIKNSGEKIPLNFEVETIKTIQFSYGHRFLKPQKFDFDSKNDYITKLRELEVFVDPSERREKILKEAEELAQQVGGTLITDEELLDEIIMITENPSAVLCDFSKDFLQIPDCVLRTVMIKHQRYLPIEQGFKLLPFFITISNNPLEQAKANIKSGNQKVIIPRFKDAEFFVQEDMKTTLRDRVNKLNKLNFLKGNMLQKTQRLQKIAKYLIDELKVYYAENPAKKIPNETLDATTEKNILEAALLAKADLTTSLVFEFTELQGEIGGIYAARQGLDKQTADTIADHYKPRFADDAEPESIGAKILSIADKLDNIVCAFALGKIPSGSADPFALRRQANGLLQVALHSHLILNIEALVDFVVDLQKSEFGSGDIVTKVKGRGDDRKEVQVAELNWDGCKEQVIEFLEQRLEFVFDIYHKEKEINKSVLAIDHPLRELNKRHMMIHLLYDSRNKSQFLSFIEAATRIINISKNYPNKESAKNKINTSLFLMPQEQILLNSIQSIDVGDKQNFAYEPLLKPDNLITFINPINDFFDNVLVNVEDEQIKVNRQALVAYASYVLESIANFTLLNQFDNQYLKSLETTLIEWNSEEDNKAYNNL